MVVGLKRAHKLGQRYTPCMPGKNLVIKSQNQLAAGRALRNVFAYLQPIAHFDGRPKKKSRKKNGKKEN